MNSKKITIITVLIISFLACAQDKNPINNDHYYKVIVKELANPWGFTFLPDNSMLINEKDGRIIHFKDDKKTEIANPPEIYLRGQGGLLENTTKGQHFGGRIVFKDNYLYFSVGDRGNRDENPQDITKDCGKIYRLHDDGRVPKDNPFVNTENAKTAIWSYGHRNPQGMKINPFTGDIWTHEHGPRGGDEVNIIKKAANYGWPVITYGINYSGTTITDKTEKEGMEQPLHYWDPSIAPSGMAFISSDKYADWKGSLLVGSLKFQYLDLCQLKDGKITKEERLLDGVGRVRSVEQGPDGYIYVGIENLGIIKLVRGKDEN